MRRWFWRIWPHRFKSDWHGWVRIRFEVDECSRCGRTHLWHHHREFQAYNDFLRKVR